MSAQLPPLPTVNPVIVIAAFLRMARGTYATPEAEARALLQRLADEGMRISFVPKPDPDEAA